MSNKELNEQLFRLDSEIQAELHAMTKNINLLTEDQLERSLYTDYVHRLSYIHNLFDRASEILRSIPLNQENPDLYALLEVKERIGANYGSYRGLQNRLSRLWELKQERDKELSREDILFSSSNTQEEEEPSESIEFEDEQLAALAKEEEDAFIAALEAEALAAEEEKILKAKKKNHERARQENFARLGRESELKSQKEYADQQSLNPESHPNGVNNPTPEISAAELRKARLREDDERLSLLFRDEERSAHERQVMEDYHRRSESNHTVDTNEQKAHFNFSQTGDTGQIDISQSVPQKEEERFFASKPQSASEQRLNHLREDDERLSSLRRDEERISQERQAMEAYRRKTEHRHDFDSYEPKTHLNFSKPTETFQRDISEPSKQTEQTRFHTPETRFNSEPRTREDYEPVSNLWRQEHVEHRHQTRDNYSFQMEPSLGSHADSYKDHREFASSRQSDIRPQTYHYGPGGYVFKNTQDSYSYHRPSPITEAGKFHVAPIEAQTPSFVSTSFEAQMRANMEAAREEYLKSRGTPGAAVSAHSFLTQRNAFADYKRAIKEGNAHAELPKSIADTVPIGCISTSIRPNMAAQYSYTPGGTVGRSIDFGVLSGLSSHYSNRVPVSAVPNTEDSHIRSFSPNTASNNSQANWRSQPEPNKQQNGWAPKPTSYNRQMDEPSKSTSNNRQNDWSTRFVPNNQQKYGAPKSAPINGQSNAAHKSSPNNSQNDEAPRPTLNNQQKYGAPKPAPINRQSNAAPKSPSNNGQNGLTDKSTPNIHQSVRPNRSHYNFNGPEGTTFQTAEYTSRRNRKKTSGEVSANVFGKEMRMHTKKIISSYAGQVGYKLEAYAPYALSRASRKLYQLMQSGEDNSLRTFETGRYYLATGIGVGYAVTHAHVVNSKLFYKQGAKSAFHQYGNLTVMDSKQLNRTIHENLKYNRAAKADIKELISKGASLTGEERKTLLSMMREHASASKEASKYYGYRKLQQENAMKVKVAKKLEADKKLIVTRKQIDKEMSSLRKKTEKQLLKKFGKNTALSDADLAKQLKKLKELGRTQKAQIKALQAKGAALTAGERKTLMRLMKEHESLNLKLRNLFGLKQARETLKAQMGILDRFRMRIVKNMRSLYSGMYALHGFIIRPLQEGSEMGAQGVAKFANIAVNRHVHRLIKTSWKHSISAAKYISEKTGITKAVKATTNVVMHSKPVVVTKEAHRIVVNYTKQSIKTTAMVTKEAAVRMTPQKIKTAANSGIKAGRFVRDRYSTAVNGVRGFVAAGKEWFAGTLPGRAFASFSRGMHKFKAALRAFGTLLKGIAVKGAIGLLIVFIIVNELTAGTITSFAGSIGSMILSPFSDDDGAIDLSPYVEIIGKEQEKFDADLAYRQTEKNYENVSINYLTDTMDNTKEMLSMMAVRLNQDLDPDQNSLVKDYLKSLFADSHFYQATERNYRCSGCETYEEEHRVWNEELQEYEIETEIVDYCPGHVDLSINVTILGFDDIFAADSMGNSEVQDGNKVAGDLIGRFEITHYCNEKYPHICNAGPPYKTATGTTPTPGRTIAVDPSVIPLGSHVIIDGREYIAEDTGGAIDDYHIDMCVNGHDNALSKGTRQNVPVYKMKIVADSEQTDNVDDEGKWLGWTEENINWCKTIYEQDWTDLYTGIDGIGGSLVGNNTDLEGVEFAEGEREGNQAIVNIAKSQIGNIGGRPYWRWYGFDSRVEWCATFVSWCANETGVLNSSVPKFASCKGEGVPWFKNNHQWASRGGTTPVAGDIIFFDWQGDGKADHVGIVVGSDGTNVYTVEGNSNDRVRTKSYTLNSSVIYGYGIPNY